MKLNKSKYCLNCKEEINSSNYCPKCGQINSDKKLTIRQILKDFLGDYFTFDSKFFRSLIPLIIKPGHLTREYIDGKRVTYIFPLRLYIFTTFVFFFVATLNTKLDFDKFVGQSEGSTKENTILNDTISTSKFDDLEKKIDKEVNRKIIYNIDSSKGEKVVEVKGTAFNFSFNESDTSNSAFVKYLNNKGKYLAGLGKDGSSLFLKEIIDQLPKVMFILLPLFALILKLIYFRNKMFYVEHLVFSLHIHTFIFILLIISVFIVNIYTVIGIFLLILTYLFFSLLNFYQQSVSKTIVKFILLISLYFIAIVPSSALLIFLAFLSV